MSKMMRTLMAGAVVLAAMAPVAAQAGSPDGKIQVKVLGTLVAPSGKSNDIAADFPGSNSKANDNFVPTVALEYFVTPNVSVETICCLTEHHLTGTGGLAGAELAKNVLILPATLTLKYHVPVGPIKPYIGAGPSVFFFLKDKVGSALAGSPFNFDKLTVKDKLGFALQAGVDIPLNDQGMSLSLDAKRYFMRPTAHFYDGGADVYDAKIKLDPWVVSAGVAYRF